MDEAGDLALDRHATVFLDVDGVLNSYPVRGMRYYREGRRTARAWRFVLHYRPAIVRRLERLIEARDASLVWLSTWSHRCTEELEPALHFRRTYAVVPMPDDSYNRFAGDPRAWWKARHVAAWLDADERRRAVWVDDDLAAPRTHAHFAAAYPGRLLMVVPEFAHGLTGAHLRTMRRFLASPRRRRGEQGIGDARSTWRAWLPWPRRGGSTPPRGRLLSTQPPDAQPVTPAPPTADSPTATEVTSPMTPPVPEPEETASPAHLTAAAPAPTTLLDAASGTVAAPTPQPRASAATPESPRVGLLDSGFGLVGFADAVLTQAPRAQLILAMDPDNMPYGKLDPARLREVTERSARRLAEWEPDAIVVACNTASVHTLEHLRSIFEPQIPIVGTVPAVKSAAAAGQPFAVWATAATTGSGYQHRLIDDFAAGIPVEQVAAVGLAEAIESGDRDRISAAVAEAADKTPHSVTSVVLGCTHYGLVGEEIAQALRERVGREVTLFDSPQAVAAQTLRRVAAKRAEQGPSADSDLPEGSVLATYLSGTRGRLPAVVGDYTAGRRLLRSEHESE